MVKLKTALTLTPVVLIGAWLLLSIEKEHKSIRVYEIPKEAVRVQDGQLTAPKGIQWDPPLHWEVKAASGMRIGSFAVRNSHGEELDISVVSLSGKAGGLTANVNRWRGQLNLPPQTATEIQANVQTQSNPKLSLTLVDLVGEGTAKGRTRIYVAIFPQGDQQVFIKMTGPTRFVESEKAHFNKFLESVRVE